MDTDNDKPSDKPGYVQVDESVRGSMLKTSALSFLSIVMPGMATNNICKIKSFSRIFHFNFARLAILTAELPSGESKESNSRFVEIISG